jgi:hypothetical protein
MQMTPSAVPGVQAAFIQSPVVQDGPPGKGKAVFFDEHNQGFLGKDVGWYDSTHAFSLDFWFYLGQDYTFTPNERTASIGKGLPFGVPIIQHRDGDGAGGQGYRLQLEDGQLWVYLAHSRPANMIALRVVKRFRSRSGRTSRSPMTAPVARSGRMSIWTAHRQRWTSTTTRSLRACCLSGKGRGWLLR